MNENEKTTVELAALTARAEHGELHHLLDGVRNQICDCLNHGQPDQRHTCLVNTMDRLRDHLETHFAHEENGGWLEEAVVHAPHLAHQLTLLERQHVPLREQANRLVSMAGKLKKDATLLEPLRNGFEDFARALIAHEAEEERVLRQGFNEDLDLE